MVSRGVSCLHSLPKEPVVHSLFPPSFSLPPHPARLLLPNYPAAHCIYDLLEPGNGRLQTGVLPSGTSIAFHLSFEKDGNCCFQCQSR